MADEPQTLDPRDINRDGNVSTAEVFAGLVQSKTVWGVLALVAGAVAPQIGENLEQNAESIVDALGLVFAAVGAVLGIWGRMTAKGPLVAKAK